MTQRFEVHQLNAASPTFDADKMRWISAQHIRKLSASACLEAATPFIESLTLPKEPSWALKAMEAFQENLETLADAQTIFQRFDLKTFSLEPEARAMQSEATPLPSLASGVDWIEAPYLRLKILTPSWDT